MNTGVIILVHGSRGERGSAEVPDVLRRVSEGVRPLLTEGVEITGAALQFNRPTLGEAVAHLVDRGAGRVAIMPYFLFSGRHITEDIPALVDGLKRQYPQTSFAVASPLGLDRSFLAQVAQCLVEAVPELAPNVRTAVPRSDIERQSMDIVEQLLPPLPGLSREQRTVVKRVVHAGGDPELAGLVRFGPSAIASGLDAIRRGSPIITDVHMVATGINSRLALQHGCSLSCAIDGVATEDGAETRTSAAIRGLAGRLNGSIVAIGNAPTALLALLDLVDGGARPALVVGMPVGFINARESKDELMKRGVPYITLVGTRGGSAIAAATVNALLKMAE